jgi:hypothetical protein
MSSGGSGESVGEFLTSSRDSRKADRAEVGARDELVRDYGSMVGVVDAMALLKQSDKELRAQLADTRTKLMELSNQLGLQSFNSLTTGFADDLMKSLVMEKRKGEMTVDRVVKYSHASLLAEHNSDPADAPVAPQVGDVPVRRSFLAYVTSAFKKAQDRYEATRPANSTGGVRAGSVDDLQRRLNKSVVYVLDAALTAVRKTYLSVVSYGTCFNILAVTRSPLAVDMANAAMCGGVGAQAINNNLYKLVQERDKLNEVFPSKDSLVCGFDNNSINYRVKSSRSGVLQNRQPMIWTMMEVFMYSLVAEWTDDGTQAEPARSIQFDPALAPIHWANKKASAPPGLTFFGHDASELPGLPEEPGNFLQDPDYLEKETCGSFLWVFDEPSFWVSFEGAKTLPEVFGEPVSGDAPFPVECLNCFELNKKSTRKCKVCGMKLRCIAQVRLDLLGASLTTLMSRRRRPRARRRAYDEIYGVGSRGEPLITKVRLNLKTLSCEIEGDEDIDSDANAIAGALKVEVKRRIMPSLFVNPSTGAAIEEIYNHWGKVTNLTGFVGVVPVASNIRSFVFVISDLGATDFSKLDDETKPYANMVHIIGMFHECKMWVELVMDLFFSIGGGDLGWFHTYMSEAAQAYLRRAGDLHKSNDFIRHVAKPALHTAYLRQYVLFRQQTNADFRLKDLKVSEAMAWGEEILADDNCSDLKLKNFLTFLFRVLPAYELIKKGVRTGDILATNAGRRYLLALAFAMGKTHYAPAIARDLIQYYHRVPTVIREELNLVFGLYDEGINGKIEESNKRQKNYTLSETRNGVQGGAILANFADGLREAQWSFGDKLPAAAHSKDVRTPTDIDVDVKRCIQYLMEQEVFKPAVNGTSVASTFRNVPIPPSLSLLELHTFGVGLQRQWIASYTSDNEPAFPKCSRGRSFRKRTRKRGGQSIVIEPGENGGEDAEGDEVEEEQALVSLLDINREGEP